MVVTRRTSHSPMPPSSRSNSSNPAPKMDKGKSTQSPSLAREHDGEVSPTNGVAEPSTPPRPNQDHSGPEFSDNVVFSNVPSPKKGTPSSPKSSPKHKSKSKGKRKEEKLRNSSTSLVDLLARMFLLFFLIYSLAVCPTDKKLQSPVCRGLSEYRRLVLEPLVIRPFQNALRHPSVSPYVELVTPHIQTVTNTVSPAVTRTKQEWESRVLPLWKDRVVPQLDKYVSPPLAKVNGVIRPYRDRVSASYERYVGPYVTHAQRFSSRARPYLLLTAAKTYDTYLIVKPHVQSATNGLQRVPPLFFKYIVTPLGSARGQFVDPHVATIIEKIKELSSGKPRSASSTSEDASSILDDEDSPVVPDPDPTERIDIDSPGFDNDKVRDDRKEAIELPLVPEPTDEPASSAASVISASAYFGEEITESVPGATYSPSPSDAAVNEEVAEADGAPVPEPEAEVDVENTESSESLVTMVVHSTSTEYVMETVVETQVKIETVPAFAEVVVTSEVIIEASEPTARSVEDAAGIEGSTTDDVQSAETSAPVDSEDMNSLSSASVPDTPSAASPSVTSTDTNDADLDLESFYADLGINDDDLEKLDVVPSGPQEETQPTQTGMSPEERAELERQRELKTAEKRKKIITRHTEWENQLEEKIKEQRKALRKALVASRKAAVADLKSSDAIREEVDKLSAESEKALRGTEAYFKKLAREGRSKEESVRVWDRVLEKVADKYSERVHSVETVVMQWYEGVLNDELAEVQRAANVIKDIGERGQADLGLDYAWLDDVTVQDWNRYHALLDKYPEFLDHAMSIQNGSHPSPPINPVQTALSDLQSEVNDITLGFETRLRRIQRQGDRAFASDKAQEVDKLDMDAAVDDTKETGESTEPIVSILPVPDQEAGEGNEEILQDVSNAILGRGKDEVVDAFDRAEPEQNVHDEKVEEAKVVHEEL